MNDLPDIEGVWVSEQSFSGSEQGPFADRSHPLRLTFNPVEESSHIAGRWTWGESAHGRVTGVALREGLQLFLAGASHGGEVTLRLTPGEDAGMTMAGVIHGTFGSIRSYPVEPPHILFSDAEVTFRRTPA